MSWLKEYGVFEAEDLLELRLKEVRQRTARNTHRRCNLRKGNI